MESIVVVGVDGVVGANFAATLALSGSVVGVVSRPLANPFCQTELMPFPKPTLVADFLKSHEIQRVVYCGEGAKSCWATTPRDARDTENALNWLEGAMSAEAGFTLISSDGIFTGPWMFHAENSQSYCESAAAVALRELEDHVVTREPSSLVIRTHALGWGPSGCDSGIERLLETLPQTGGTPLDYARHASPLLATDLVAVVEKAWAAGLAGVYHVAGAERVNPAQFGQRLALQFGINTSPSILKGTLNDSVQGFGRGETSLQTRKIRRALGVGMPLLSESLQRLHEQSLNGFRQRLQRPHSANRAA